ncbi:2-oxoacid ferredoxin oxidoreductase [Staphylococcus succinus]|jgi:2-oxoglutarate ferredoxin oxidoreductase subunit beta|uniref:2-oxoacid:ferredoxin oxidoreductase subunit beta n=1 Tax=Staphylococcus TaxID=1279 RepID=UPI00062B78BE|nr:MULTISPECIES: 2-oxoacid:ferredoxin oxidoreductase subunit beta [Staphylococcus]MDH9160461.1 2-oxoacid:ferredoxin oxidoreductase subunit beta [Staphylococcus succinus]MEB7461643.1 2-oxoacid:ferredoxin oxidoreductase subunit beta [Staphylococcus succinus]MEB8124391.1 2-oxoacid:ferredoxin oxidoreductase subunit beta [Staphylococcus succinus]OIJ30573.1 2-oxoacid ferredoxin oxidoreductase [Staphylococcus sp. LCT-H4]PKI23027.1 2-oxoacid ferredoxin oxidoreductase [Staphylococcus succinus]
MATFKDFRNNVKPNWCPGCGDFSVQAAIQKATANVGLEPEEVAIITGIGCSGRLSGYVNSYGMHGIHGRSLPLAQGVKMANKDLTVIASGGDGDGYAIGMGHTIHALRRNMNMTYIVMDNQIYGLTKGQTSPSSAPGFVTKSTPKGNIEQNVAPLELALSSGATFVAQGFSSDIKALTKMIEDAINHDGFSFVNVFSPCVTYNKVNTYDWFKENLTDIEDIEDYDMSSKSIATQKVLEYNSLIKGIVYQDTETPSYESQIEEMEGTPLAKKDIHIDEAQFNELTKQFV